MAYVYKHIRKDNNEIFYIGIGLDDKTLKRAYYKYGRNQHWRNIVEKFGYFVEIIESNLTWDEACNLEKTLILKYGRRNMNEGELVNMTDGGVGIIGLIHTNEHREKNSEANKGKPKSDEFKEKARKRIQTEETKRKISLSNKGKNHTEETKRKISNKLKNKMIGEKNPFYGKNHTEETKKKIRDFNSGRKMSEETKRKISDRNKGKTRFFTEEAKMNMSISAKKRTLKPPSRKGACWISKNGISKTIKIGELDIYTLNGWVRGRKNKT